MTTITPHDETVTSISDALDQYLYAGIYKKGANQLEFALTSLSHMSKVSKKLVPIKVYSFVFGILCSLAFFRLIKSSPVKGILYMMMAFDSYRLSYNCYDRAYATIAARRTLSSAKELGSVVKSFFTCGTTSKDSEQSDMIKSLAQDVKWKFLLDGTFSEMVCNKIRDSSIIG